MTTDDHIIAQFKNINDSLTAINTTQLETNKALGAVETAQKAQQGAIESIGDQVSKITRLHETCPAMAELDDLREATGAIETDVESLKAYTPKAGAPQWVKQVFTTGNVKLLLIILLLLVCGILGISAPII